MSGGKGSGSNGTILITKDAGDLSRSNYKTDSSQVQAQEDSIPEQQSSPKSPAQTPLAPPALTASPAPPAPPAQTLPAPSSPKRLTSSPLTPRILTNTKQKPRKKVKKYDIKKEDT